MAGHDQGIGRGPGEWAAAVDPGLSRGNCSRLLAGMPIQFSATPYGVDVDILICAGANEMAIAEALGLPAGDPRITPDPDEGAV